VLIFHPLAAKRSRCYGEDGVSDFRRAVALLDLVDDQALGQNLYSVDRFRSSRAIGHDAGQGGNVGEPSAIVFALDLD
jgi:hypothetical protein